MSTHTTESAQTVETLNSSVLQLLAYLGVEQLNRAGHAHGDVVLGHGGTGLGVVILIHVEAAVAAASHEEVSVLGQMTRAPHGCLLSCKKGIKKLVLKGSDKKRIIKEDGKRSCERKCGDGECVVGLSSVAIFICLHISIYTNRYLVSLLG